MLHSLQQTHQGGYTYNNMRQSKSICWRLAAVWIVNVLVSVQISSVTSFTSPIILRKNIDRSILVRNAVDDDDVNGCNEEYPQLKIAFVTGNEMKAREMRMILAEHGATKGPDPEISMVDLRVLNVDLPEIQGKYEERIKRQKLNLFVFFKTQLMYRIPHSKISCCFML